jgi:hypothetical protein
MRQNRCPVLFRNYRYAGCTRPNPSLHGWQWGCNPDPIILFRNYSLFYCIPGPGTPEADALAVAGSPHYDMGPAKFFCKNNRDAHRFIPQVIPFRGGTASGFNSPVLQSYSLFNSCCTPQPDNFRVEILLMRHHRSAIHPL